MNKDRLLLFNAKHYFDRADKLFWRMDCSALHQIFNCVVGEEAAREMFKNLDDQFFIELINLSWSIRKITEIDRVTGETVKEVEIDDDILDSDPAEIFENMKENIFIARRMSDEEARNMLSAYFDQTQGTPQFEVMEDYYEFNGIRRTTKQYAMSTWRKEGQTTIAVRVTLTGGGECIIRGPRHTARIVERNTGEVLLDCYGSVHWYDYFVGLVREGIAFDLYTEGLHGRLVRSTKLNHTRTHQRKDGTWYVDPSR